MWPNNMMNITAIAGSWARRWLPNGSVALKLPPKSVAEDVLEPLGIPMDEVGLFAVNGMAVFHGTPLNEGDTVRIFPIIMGG